MYRFRISSLERDFFTLSGNELHHLTHVLRLKPGQELIGYDNSGRQWLGVLESVNKNDNMALCRIIEEHQPEVEAKTKVYIVMGLAKGEKLEWVIQKGTELGMAGFTPLRAKRAVVQLEGRKAQERVVRWQKIVLEAVKQSRRVVEPIVSDVMDWQDLKAYFPENTQWLIPYEDEKNRSLHNTLTGFDPQYPIAILIGPEGGFAPEEVAWAREKLKAESVSLGPRILRTETAALNALIMVLSFFGDMG